MVEKYDTKYGFQPLEKVSAYPKEISVAKKKPDHETAFTTLVEETGSLRRFEAKHPEIVKRLRELENNVERSTETLRKACRELSRPGETVSVIDDSRGSVQVIGAMGGAEYDYWKAIEWGPKIIDKVRMIDSKKVAALIELGELDSGFAAKAEKERVALTPRVIVRVK